MSKNIFKRDRQAIKHYLAHNPGSNDKEIANKLGLEIRNTQNILIELICLHEIIHNSKGGYLLVVKGMKK